MTLTLTLTTFLLGMLVPAVTLAQNYDPGITRAEFVRLVLEQKGLPVYAGSRCFTDVADQTFAPSICTARQYGFIAGDPSGGFRPYDRILFVEAASVVVRAEGVSVPYDSIWYRPYVDQLGRWNAYPASLYSMFDTITYNQAVEMIEKAKGRGQGIDTQRGLTLQVTASDDEPEPGDRMTFRLRLENTTDRELRGIVVSADLDNDMDYISSTDYGDEYGGRVEWKGIQVNARTSKTILLTVEINEDARNGDTLQLRAVAAGKAVTHSIRVSDRRREDVRIDVSDSPDPARRGETIMYRIALQNREYDRVRVTPRAFLDDNTTFVSATEYGRQSGDSILWDDMVLNAYEERVILLWVRLDDDVRTGDRSTVRVQANGAEDSETTEIRDEWFYDENIRISITDSPDPVWRGDQLTYWITVENLASRDITADVRAILDGNTFALASSPNASFEGSNEVLWKDLRLNRYESRTLSLTTRVSNGVSEGDTLRLRVQAGNNEDTETTRIE